MAAGLDDVDRTLLELLRGDGRMSIRALAERAHISRANAYARLDRLRRDGVIRGFTVVIDPEKCGAGLAAYVSVRIEQHSWERFRDHLRHIPEIDHAALVSGDADLLLLVRVADAPALRTLVLERLQRIPEVHSTRTMFILDEPPVMHRP
ncbi:Lrp/AsnC family transcriptional regulator [Marinactinospora thermotolerans]|uniref:Transcriptional regulator, AsnC family n=1 Tax=Marinactinospora thermotolerans DSM 45154 TaxID=1122192 RepID=A0A1T4M2V5_9ACTN|nr:Lrp/AsnC family transcriptional regulator [Marinactinospora thermotolerans]SJZ61216.1 transcriptional regulator, AsnC family [Marinactinospora thermotolerans DSM 45154]